ncbi:serine/threonine protein kinase, putative [Plasmodium yoelii]|uniref:Serine/threonine protein kinase n=2 Tax=Plasmodium yoelii TaxID=5861 RepID=A0AAF0B8A8_PLAYO|nr:serine/threonine protein kinase, putative [Plasmodium yoelii]WBY60315.1 serine/threonine protein kinase [Plasmodium yoelii yoelii]CDU20193.1 serine/threonine protein kinase, putative [Plasmodium yoelii]VTZ80951.1 serine/threonine protein kinase, putative [Plasmodium yoelii]|eukprot:XP_022813723.1 serine/threonine protein kinase, putative [Plasmodium yoelii]
MKLYSCVIYTFILCKIISLIKVFYCSFWYLINVHFFVNNLNYNEIWKNNITDNKNDVLILFISPYLTSKHKKLQKLFNNNNNDNIEDQINIYLENGNQKNDKNEASVSSYIVSLLFSKDNYIVLFYIFSYIYYYYIGCIQNIVQHFIVQKQKHKTYNISFFYQYVYSKEVYNNTSKNKKRYLNFIGNIDKIFNLNNDNEKNNNSILTNINSKGKYGYSSINDIIKESQIKKDKNKCVNNKSTKCEYNNEKKNIKNEIFKLNKYKKQNKDHNHYINNILNNKYYLKKKIKTLLKKTKITKPYELEVIHLPRPEIIQNETTVIKQNKENVCSKCVINLKEPLYSLKIRDQNIYSDIEMSIQKEKQPDIETYYDFDKVFYLSDVDNEEDEYINEDKPTYKSMSNLIKNKYKMLNFTKHLFLENTEKNNEIDKYYNKRTNYSIQNKLGGGAYGEIWYGINLNKNIPFQNVVLKKILIKKSDDENEQNLNDDEREKEYEIYAMREVYFGEIFKNCDNISRYIEHFKESEISENNKEHVTFIWIVFANEGYSLSQHLFETDKNNSGMVIPSKLWWSIKKQNIGMLVIKDLMRQILNGINIAHKKNITHRDIKMENIFVSPNTPFTVRIGDWGSAVEYKNESFFFTPSMEEETEGYQPPESLFGHMKNNFMRLPYYDMWGIGILFLQFVLGTKNPLEIKNKRNEVKLKQIYSKYSKDILKEVIFIQGLSDLCIIPWVSQTPDRLIPLYDMKNNEKNLLQYSSIYGRNLIINKLEYFASTKNLIEIKRKKYNLINNMMSNKYNSLISLPNSPVCPNWKCLHKYNEQASYNNNNNNNNNTFDNVQNKFLQQKKENYTFFKNNCNDEQFQKILQERDPSGVGLPDKNARDLLRRLLDFDYNTRITSEEALKHAWFSDS